jgi:hypothetical protein
MDTREVRAQHTIEMLERIAALTAPRNLLQPTIFPAGPLCMQTYRTPNTPEERNACIAEAAYFIAMHRGFSPGHELQDWLTAENEVDARLMGPPRDY